MNPEIERIRLRCVCGEDGCWRWSGSMNRSGIPTVCRYVDGERKNMSGRRWVYEQARGVKLNAGDFVVVTCGTAECLNPEHLKRSTRSAIQRQNHKKDPGLRHRRGMAIKAAWTRKGAGHKLTSEQADYARDPSIPSKQVAAELGISVTLVNYIRAGKAWKPTGSPLASMAGQLMAANDSSRRAA